MNFQPQEGSAIVQWTVDAPALSDTTRGRLTGLKSTDIQMTQTAPVAEDSQSDIEDGDKAKPAPSRKPGPAEKAAVAKAGGTLSDTPAWPFPKDKAYAHHEAPPQSATVEIERSQPGTRTARGREKTAAALAKGAAA